VSDTNVISMFLWLEIAILLQDVQMHPQLDMKTLILASQEVFGSLPS
jgi:hypothetical protein